MTESWPDVEGALRAYLRADAGVAAIVGARVFFGVPRGATEATFPLITVQRVGGGADTSEAPLDIALVQIDCWGVLDASGNGDKAGATALLNTVRSACSHVTDPTIRGINVQTVIWLPDPDTDRPRYSVTAEVAAIS